MLSIPTQITANGRIYTVVDDVDTVYWALITGAVVDGAAGGDFRHDFTVTPDLPGMTVRTIDGGLYCLAGYPEQVFPNLATMGYTVALTIAAQGYRGVSLPVPVPQNSAFPVGAPITPLRPLPVRVQGRVVDDASRAPLPGAMVRTDDSPGPPHVVSLRGPLHFAHPAGTAVREQPFSNAGPAKQLAVAAAGSSATVTLTNRAGLAPGGILRLGSAEPREFGIIASLAATPANPALPGDVALTALLGRSLPAGADVQPVTPGAAGTVRHLVADADAGDGLVLLDGPLNVATVAVADAAPARVEYGSTGVLTDAQGFYALDGVGHVARVGLIVSAPAHLSDTIPVVIDYSQAVSVVDCRLKP